MAKQKLNYRQLKKVLNRYHKFSFGMPRKGKDFTPQQKSAITRKVKQYGEYIENVQKDKNSFIPYPDKSKLPLIDGVRTNKGIFYKYPDASIVPLSKSKKRKQYTVKVTYKRLRELFIPFPNSVLSDLTSMSAFVEKQRVKYKPDYIVWSVNGFRGRTLYSPEAFELYAVELQLNTQIVSALKNKPFFNGVFFGWEPK